MFALECKLNDARTKQKYNIALQCLAYSNFNHKSHLELRFWPALPTKKHELNVPLHILLVSVPLTSFRIAAMSLYYAFLLEGLPINTERRAGLKTSHTRWIAMARDKVSLN